MLVFLTASARGNSFSALFFPAAPATAVALGATAVALGAAATLGLGGGAFRPSEVEVRLRPRGAGAGAAGPRGGTSLEDVPARARGGRDDGPDRLDMLDLGDSSARREVLPEGELPLLLSREGTPSPLTGREPGRDPGREAGREPALGLKGEGAGLGRLLALREVEDLTRPPLATPPTVEIGLLARADADADEGVGEGSGRAAPRLTRATDVALRPPRPSLA